MAYTKEQIYEVLKKREISSVKEFRTKEPAIYLWYTRHKKEIGELPLSYAKRPNGTLTKGLCKEIALKYKHRSDFQNNEKGAYGKALKENFLDEICVHMVPKEYDASQTEYVLTKLKGKSARNQKDLTGLVFNNWTVLGRAGIGKSFGWTCRCKCGNERGIPTANLKLNLSTKCHKCSNQISKPSREIAEFIESLGYEVSLSDRTFGFELDVVVHSKKFIIEYDGLIWHSTKFRNTEASERARYKKILSTGYNCLRIFEDEWLDRPDILKDMIKNRLGNSNSAPTPTYRIRLVENPVEYREFFELNHLDGYGRSSFGFGAFSEGRLVSIMTFRSYMQGPHKGQMELARFCSDRNVNAYGIFGQLLKQAIIHIRKHNLAIRVVSASDNRISKGKVYANNGFKLVEGSDHPLNYYYYLHSKGLRVHRGVCKKLKPPKISAELYHQYPTERLQTESGIMAEYKWGKREPLYKIYGWGNKLWVRDI